MCVCVRERESRKKRFQRSFNRQNKGKWCKKKTKNEIIIIIVVIIIILVIGRLEAHAVNMTARKGKEND